MPSDTTVDVTGNRSIPIKTTGHEKIITQLYYQRKQIKPFVVFKGKGTCSLSKQL